MESVTNYELMQKLKDIEHKLNNLSEELIKEDTHMNHSVDDLEENKQVNTPCIQEATCYITKSGQDIERQEHADLWHTSRGVITGIAWVDRKKKLHFNPYDHTLSSLVDPIVRYSFDYGETWIKTEEDMEIHGLAESRNQIENESVKYITIKQLIELAKRFDFLLGLNWIDNGEEPDIIVETKRNAEESIINREHELDTIPIGWYYLFVQMCEDLDKEFQHLTDIGYFKERKDKRDFYQLYVVAELHNEMEYDWSHYIGTEGSNQWDDNIPFSLTAICDRYTSLSKWINIFDGTVEMPNSFICDVDGYSLCGENPSFENEFNRYVNTMINNMLNDEKNKERKGCAIDWVIRDYSYS